jgi:hypothetical protein
MLGFCKVPLLLRTSHNAMPRFWYTWSWQSDCATAQDARRYFHCRGVVADS